MRESQAGQRAADLLMTGGAVDIQADPRGLRELGAVPPEPLDAHVPATSRAADGAVVGSSVVTRSEVMVGPLRRSAQDRRGSADRSEQPGEGRVGQVEDMGASIDRRRAAWTTEGDQVGGRSTRRMTSLVEPQSAHQMLVVLAASGCRPRAHMGFGRTPQLGLEHPPQHHPAAADAHRDGISRRARAARRSPRARSPRGSEPRGCCGSAPARARARGRAGRRARHVRDPARDPGRRLSRPAA